MRTVRRERRSRRRRTRSRRSRGRAVAIGICRRFAGGRRSWRRWRGWRRCIGSAQGMGRGGGRFGDRVESEREGWSGLERQWGGLWKGIGYLHVFLNLDGPHGGTLRWERWPLGQEKRKKTADDDGIDARRHKRNHFIYNVTTSSHRRRYPIIQRTESVHLKSRPRLVSCKLGLGRRLRLSARRDKIRTLTLRGARGWHTAKSGTSCSRSFLL